MKKLIIITLISIAFASCGSKDEPNILKLDPNAMISIKPAYGASKAPAFVKVTDTHLSALDIVKQTTIIQYNFNNLKWERVFESNQRDTVSSTPCLKMYGVDIINQDGNYVPDFIESADCILIKFNLHAPAGAPRDTLGYIPNSTIRSAQIIIKQAYENKDEALMIKTFNEAFTFIPITGAEYKTLKAQNLQ